MTISYSNGMTIYKGIFSCSKSNLYNIGKIWQVKQNKTHLVQKPRECRIIGCQCVHKTDLSLL